MRRIVQAIDIGASALVVALSFVHTFGFGSIHVGPITAEEVWFAGAGAAMFFTGAMNGLRAVQGATRALSLLCAFAAAIMLALVTGFAAAIGGFGAWQVVVQLLLYGLLLCFALGQAFAASSDTPR